MRSRPQQLLPFAAASMISLPYCSRALAFVSIGGVTAGGPLTRITLQRQAARGFRGTLRVAGSQSRWKYKHRMELAEVAAAEADGKVVILAKDEVVEAAPVAATTTVEKNSAAPLKTPQSRLLYAPPKFTPTPYEYLQEITVKIQSLTNLGEGIARDGESDWVVMVPQVIPGEVVKCKVFRNHNNYSEATLVEVLEASPDRVEPQCPLFGLCGGCQYQHMSVGVQREWKRQQVVDCLTRIGGMEEPDVKPTFGTDNTYNYRSKLTPHYDTPFKGEVRGIGFQKVKFPTVYHGIDLSNVNPHKVVDVERCHIATDAINDALPAAREAARKRVSDAYASDSKQRVARHGATLLFRETSEDGCVTDIKADVSEKVNDKLFTFRAGEFFQNNPHVLPHMVDYVVDRAKERGAKYLIDAYCGGGLFCLSASSSFEQCAGIEISALSVDAATRNAAKNDIRNCLFLAGTASNIFANVSFSPEETVIIVDPPRKGCDELFLGQLFKFRPSRLVYVSCDPSTQARDAKEIIKNGYEAVDIQPFDLFPQTRHIENIITFRDTRASPSPPPPSPSP